MRAFLSDLKYRAAWQRVNRLPGPAAVREVRKILAVAEPSSNVAAHIPLSRLGEVWIGAPVDNNAHAALVEALDAFTEAPECEECAAPIVCSTNGYMPGPTFVSLVCAACAAKEVR